jgi:2,3-bisphosphoglycerate-dependent phosphoglycerate mutase
MAYLVLLRHGESQWNLENRFTGWVDVPLSPKGEEEARQAGEKLKGAEIRFDRAFTSVLQRAIRTLEIVLEVLEQKDLPVEKEQALNERHYGDLQGLNKTETAKRYGDEQVRLWRRSYDIAPPGGESLKDTAARTLPYFQETILPVVKEERSVLVSAHGNSLRSIIMHLDQLSREEVLTLELGTGLPVVYEIDTDGRVQAKRLLEDSAQLMAGNC